jgi:hypothetical protein
VEGIERTKNWRSNSLVLFFCHSSEPPTLVIVIRQREELNMWKHEQFFEVSVEERNLFNKRIEEAYRKRGYTIHVEDIEGIPHSAYINFNKLTKKYSFVCGEYWNEETNILLVISMAHEMGHYLDITENFEGDMVNYHKTLGDTSS